MTNQWQVNSSTATEQWPDALSARYHAMVLGYDRTLRQFPKWIEYLEATTPALSFDQKQYVAETAKKVAAALRDDEAKEHVDPALPDALERMASSMQTTTNPNNPSNKHLADRNDALAHDLLESINNTCKTIAEKLLEGTRAIADFGATYISGIAKGFHRAAEKQSQKDGDGLFKWGRRALIWGAGGIILKDLLEKFPNYFGWLQVVRDFLGGI